MVRGLIQKGQCDEVTEVILQAKEKEMGHFLRDQLVSNVTITGDMLGQIAMTFMGRASVINANIAEGDGEKKAILSYVIRFDGKGYRVFNSSGDL